MDVGPMELMLILGIVVVLFGAGKVAELGGALGKSVSEFRKAVHDGSSEEPAAPPPDTNVTATTLALVPPQPVVPAPPASTAPWQDFVPDQRANAPVVALMAGEE